MSIEDENFNPDDKADNDPIDIDPVVLDKLARLLQERLEKVGRGDSEEPGDIAKAFEEVFDYNEDEHAKAIVGMLVGDFGLSSEELKGLSFEELQFLDEALLSGGAIRSNTSKEQRETYAMQARYLINKLKNGKA